MKCRYEPWHGDFATPVKLAQHYRERHADVYVAPTQSEFDYRCRICDRMFRNPSSHMNQKHSHFPKPFQRYFDRLDRATGAVQKVGTYEPVRPANSPVAVVRDSEVEPIEPPTSKHERHIGPWEADDIVLPVVEQLASPKGLLPVAHLAAIFAWRDATAVMLDQVTRQ